MATAAADAEQSRERGSTASGIDDFFRRMGTHISRLKPVFNYCQQLSLDSMSLICLCCDHAIDAHH